MLKVQELKELIELINKSTISEFVYEVDGSIVKIKKPKQLDEQNVAQEQVVQVPVTPVVQQEQVQQTNQVTEQPTEAVTDEQDANTIEIVSPMVGTFYRKPSPESDPYVEVGDTVNDKTVVCIVEAMKLFNEIEAELSGEIVDILVEDGELVEFGQPLFKVKTK